MITKSECKSSWYGTRYIICPDCKQRAGYHVFFDSNIKRVFKCKCNKGIRQIKKEIKMNKIRYCNCKKKKRIIFMTICLNCCRFLSPKTVKKIWRIL